MSELLRALAVLCERPAAGHRAVAEAAGLGCLPDPADHTETFGLQLYPYASVYVGAEGMLGGEAGDRVAGFWRALELEPPAEPDHLASLLGLYATLTEAGCRDAGRALLWEHLLSWLPAYLAAFEVAPPCYRSWARLLQAALLAEAETAGEQARLPLHLRLAPALPDPREEGAADFVGALLAPVRSGLVLPRAALAGAGGELGLGLRMGERAFMLRALLAQDAPATLAWLGGHARTWARRHRSHAAPLGAVAEFWAGRAEASAALLDALAAADGGAQKGSLRASD
jgi:hypothetical protein